MTVTPNRSRESEPRKLGGASHDEKADGRRGVGQIPGTDRVKRGDGSIVRRPLNQ